MVIFHSYVSLPEGICRWDVQSISLSSISAIWASCDIVLGHLLDCVLQPQQCLALGGHSKDQQNTVTISWLEPTGPTKIHKAICQDICQMPSRARQWQLELRCSFALGEAQPWHSMAQPSKEMSVFRTATWRCLHGRVGQVPWASLHLRFRRMPYIYIYSIYIYIYIQYIYIYICICICIYSISIYVYIIIYIIIHHSDCIALCKTLWGCIGKHGKKAADQIASQSRQKVPWVSGQM